MTAILKGFMTLAGILVFCSCEYKGPTSFKVENNSDYSFDLYFKRGLKWDSLISVKPLKTETFFLFEDINGMRDREDQFLSRAGIDSIYFVVSPDSLKITKNVMKRENWDYSTKPFKKDKEGRAGDNIYTFRIINDDIK